VKLTRLFNEFFNSEKAGGIILILCTIFSLALANSPVSESYIHFWHYELGGKSVEYWINDGLMTVFFLLIGLELEREVYAGELSDIRNSLLPLFAALGGMLIPAAFFLSFNYGTPTQSGAGIPMATDIAFAIGILSLLGNRVPGSLKILLTAIAVIDDLGAIIIIAIFYTSSLSLSFLFAAIIVFLFLLGLNRFKVVSFLPYFAGGIAMWYFMARSGVHPTITGVLLAFAFPFGKGDTKSPSYKLQHFLHKPVAFFIIPVFALANTCITLGDNWTSGLFHSNSIGIFAGLAAGKPIGIFLFSLLAVKTRLSKLPSDVKLKHLTGLGFLAGIGFTMSIFITLLAYSDAEMINLSKITILISSLTAGTLGYLLLSLTLKPAKA
jgi:NhaA family Na+:H+ antiporter